MIIWKWQPDSSHVQTRADVAILGAIEAGEGAWFRTDAAAAAGLPQKDIPDEIQDDEKPKVSRSQIQRLMEQGQVTQAGIPLKASSRIKAGSEIEIRFPSPKPLEITPEDKPLELLYEDEHLVVINKPPGLTVHPSPTQMEGTLVHILLHHIKDLSGIGGMLRPGIVHRIDKDTSGALVVTKTDRAHQELVRTFSRHEIERRYWALCYGAPKDSKEVLVESLIGRNPSDRKKMSMTVTQGRKAITYYKRVEAYALPNSQPFASWIEARLKTGRTHQVRVHLTGQGFSLLGDPVYGVPTQRQSKWLALPADVQARVEALPGQALHARVLGFRHPVTGKDLYFEAPLPESFRLLLETLQRYR